MKVKDLMEQCKGLVERGYGEQEVNVFLNQFDILPFERLSQDAADGVWIMLDVSEDFKDWIKGTFVPYGDREGFCMDTLHKVEY